MHSFMEFMLKLSLKDETKTCLGIVSGLIRLRCPLILFSLSLWIVNVLNKVESVKARLLELLAREEWTEAKRNYQETYKQEVTSININKIDSKEKK